MIKIPFSPRRTENRDRRGAATPLQGSPCIVCGKAVTNPIYMVHVHNGGSHLVMEDEAAAMNPAADMYWYPLGRDCYRKHTELQPYAAKVRES